MSSSSPSATMMPVFNFSEGSSFNVQHYYSNTRVMWGPDRSTVRGLGLII